MAPAKGAGADCPHNKSVLFGHRIGGERFATMVLLNQAHQQDSMTMKIKLEITYNWTNDDSADGEVLAQHREALRVLAWLQTTSQRK